MYICTIFRKSRRLALPIFFLIGLIYLLVLYNTRLAFLLHDSNIYNQIVSQQSLFSDVFAGTVSRIAWAFSGINMFDMYEENRFLNEFGGLWKQGWSVQYQESDFNATHPLRVILIPHSHQDPGWLQTFQTYMDMASMPSMGAMLSAFQRYNYSKFIYAEMSFFQAWFDSRDQQTRDQVAGHLRSGRFEIVTGGWVMNDEANTHYFATLEQLTEGQQWLADNLDYRPKYAWAIDPFGHSATMAYLLRKSQMDAILIQRTHYEVKKQLASKQNLEFFWRQAWQQRNNKQEMTFTHMMPFMSYDSSHSCGPDASICCQFDFTRYRLTGEYSDCQDKWGESAAPAEEITQANLESKADILVTQYKKKASLYRRHNMLLVPLGDDFRYTTLNEWSLQMENYKRLFDFINANEERFHVKARVGTLADYFDEVLRERENLAFPTLSGDMFSYADKNADYWTGYFTSRPFHKRLSRLLEQEIYASNVLFSLAVHAARPDEWTQEDNFFEEALARVYELLRAASRNLSLFQHHDGVTGTSKTFVMEDYAERMLESLKHARKVSVVALYRLLAHKQASQFWSDLGVDAADDPRQLATRLTEACQQEMPHLVSASVNLTTERAPVPHTLTYHSVSQAQVHQVILFNPTLHDAQLLIRFLLQFPPGTDVLAQTVHFRVEMAGQQLPCQWHVLFDPAETEGQLVRRNGTNSLPSGSAFLLVVSAPTRIGAWQVATLAISMLPQSVMPASGGTVPPSVPVMRMGLGKAPWSSGLLRWAWPTPVLESPDITLYFDPHSYLLRRFVNKRTGDEIDLSLDLLVYFTWSGGAYLFKPRGEPRPYSWQEPPMLRLVDGPVMAELTVFDRVVQHTVRLYKQAREAAAAIEIENVVDLRDQPENIELGMQLRSSMVGNDAQGVFYTDSNCYQFMPRRFHEKLPRQANVYPMSCASFVEGPVPANSVIGGSEETWLRLTLLSGQPAGVFSFEPGQLVAMLDRRLFLDDGRGLSYAPKDNLPVRTEFKVLVEQIWQTGQFKENIPRLTRDAQLVLESFLRPPSVFVASAKRPTSLPEKRFFRTESVHPSLELVALKTFRHQAKSRLGMSVRRYEPQPGGTGLFPRPLLQAWRNASIELSLGDILGLKNISKCQPASATLLPLRDTQDAATRDRILVEPFEMESCLLVGS